ncbi:MAG: S-layer homology domain-containing protein [Butyricicoccus pullicaecorum]|nr:S-layer homology domain-containing protein [Butyricicoccus pullicaecorum]
MKKKRLLASIVTAVMLFTMVPPYALANDSTVSMIDLVPATPTESTQTDVPDSTECTMTADCTAEVHQEGCPAAPAEDVETDVPDTKTCTMSADCTAEVHQEGCPAAKLVADEPETETETETDEQTPCTKTKGCTLMDGHEGECEEVDNTAIDIQEDIAVLNSEIDVGTLQDHTITSDCVLTGTGEEQIILDGRENPITVAVKQLEIRIDSGWYDMTSGIKILGDVTLSLEGTNEIVGGDGYRTGCAAIEVDPDAVLTIEGDGRLTALAGCGTQEVTGSQNYTKWARGGDAIGGNGQEGSKGPEESGDFVLKSGTVIAQGMAGGSGIGCTNIEISGGTVEAAARREDKTEYDEQDGGGYGIGSRKTESIVVRDAKVTAEGDAQGAGIGASDQIEIAGDAKIKAIGGAQGAGIGNGFYNERCPDILITGNAEIDAEGGNSAPGIGLVTTGNDAKITISGDVSVIAQGGAQAAGIGGRSSDEGILTIEILEHASTKAIGGASSDNGFGAGAGIGSNYSWKQTAENHIIIDTTGKIEAVGGQDIDNRHGPGSGAGIGGAAKCSGGSIEIKNGTIIATGGESTWGSGAGIGGGSLGTSGDIHITGGEITATGGNYAAAIGSGYNADVESIIIDDGNLTVTAGQYGTGIGSGQRGAAGQITINGGVIHAQGVVGNAIGSGHQGGTGTITFNGGETYAVSSNHYGVSAIGGGRKGAACEVKINSGAIVYAFGSGLGNENYDSRPAFYDLALDSTGNVVQGTFHFDHPIKNMTLQIGDQTIQSPEVNYWSFAFTVPQAGEYTLTTTIEGKTLAATTGDGDAATTQLMANQQYENLYWSETDEGGKPINPEQPDPIEPDEDWMNGYQGSAVYDSETDTTTITGSIVEGKYLYMIPADVRGKVVLDGSGYVDALINQHVNKYEELWYPGAVSDELPIVVKNQSNVAYTYADINFGVDDQAKPAERYHISKVLGRLGQQNDKDILRVACQPIQALYGKSSDALSTEEVLHAMDKVEELYPEQFDSFGDYALWYYQQNFEDAKDAKSLLGLPVQYQLNLMGYASAEWDYPDLVQGNMGTWLPKNKADQFLNSLSEDERKLILTQDYENDLGAETGLYVLESDPAILEMGRYVAYTYGIAFTFDKSAYSITSGESGSTEEDLKYLNEELGWNALCNADFSAAALQKENLTEAQKMVRDTVAQWNMLPDETQKIDRGQLVMPGYAIPNAMFSTAMLRGLTMDIEFTPSYAVIYQGNGGITADQQDTIVDGYRAAGESYTIRQNMFQREGYDFAGWKQVTSFNGLNVAIGAEIEQPAGTVILQATWEEESGGGGAHHPDPDPDPDPDDNDDDEEEIIDEEVPLAETPWLNTVDHYAYIVGYPEDYVTGQPTEDESRWPVKPQANISRAEVATIFFRLLTDEARDQFWMTTNNFPDVAPDAWYNNAISTMVNAGIIQGYEDGAFRPNNNITRAEFAAIASRFMSSGYDVEEDLFTDIANHWARENINDAAMTQWIHGYPDGTFLPDQAITRAEAVTLVNNVLQRKPHKDHMLDSMIKWPDNPESAWYYEAIQEATNSHDYDLFEDAEYETWTALQENRDWAALEKDWVNTHRTGGEVA